MTRTTAGTTAGTTEHRLLDDPDDDRLVDSPADLEKASWAYVVRRTFREFSSDHCTDLAAALTYYSVLAIFPAAIALTSLLGLVDRGTQAVDEVLKIVERLGGGSVADTLRPTLLEIAGSQGAGLAFVLGLAGALWSASGYVGAFGRAMNEVYEVQEGRPFWKLRPQMLLLTALLVVLAGAVLLALVVTGPVAEAVGDALGIGSTVVLVWGIAKWPVLLAVVVVIVALLYYATPNVRQPKFRWVSVGAVLAIVTWILLSVGFGLYVSHLGSYDSTYGSLGGVIVFLLWLWLTNVALLFGAELDSELERGRELQSGLPAEETLQLPARDTRTLDKARRKEQEDLRRGESLRRGRRRRKA